MLTVYHLWLTIDYIQTSSQAVMFLSITNVIKYQHAHIKVQFATSTNPVLRIRPSSGSDPSPDPALLPIWPSSRSDPPPDPILLQIRPSSRSDPPPDPTLRQIRPSSRSDPPPDPTFFQIWPASCVNVEISILPRNSHLLLSFSINCPLNVCKFY